MDPSTGPDIATAAASVANAIWQAVARSTLADYFTIFAVYLFLNKRRNDPPTEDDDDLSTTKNSLSIVILCAELCRYCLPLKYVWNDKDLAAPADQLIVDAASKVIPSFLPIVAAFCSLLLLGFEPLHNRMPSMLPTMTLATTFVFRTARYLALEHPLHSYYSDISLVILSLQLGLVLLQLFWKVFVCTPSPTAGQTEVPIWRRISPGWFTTMLMLPHVEFESLDELVNLYAPPMAFGSQPLFRPIAAVCDSSSETMRDPMQHFGFTVLRSQFFAIIPPRLILVGFTYAMPYLVQDTVTLAGEKPTVTDICKTIGLTALVYGGKTIANAWYEHYRARFSTQLRTTLINAMSEKLLVMSQKRAQKFNLVRLFGKDLENIDCIARAFHDFWSSLLELACGLYLVTSISRGSLYMGIFIPLVATVCEPIVKRMTQYDQGWKDIAKKRIAMADLYLNQFKELKYTGYVLSFNTALMKLRGEEIGAANRTSVHGSMLLGFYAACRTAAPVAIISTALYKSTTSDPWTVPEYFAIAAVTPLIAKSWRTLITSATVYLSKMEGFTRAQEFMQEPDSEHKDRGNQPIRSDFKKRNLQLLQTSFSAPDSTSFRYRDLRFEAGKVTMVIGPKGCGKSSLLKALLGEIPLVSGNIVAPSGPIAYSAETSFVQNQTIRDNIVGQSVFDPIWYQHVLHACTLQTEMERLPDADETMAGEGGSKILDFRHLVSLARAVYAKHPVMLLDETFDYFEPEMADTILTRLFGPGGLLRNKCTVVFTSSTSRDSEHADTILAFNDMRGIQEISPSLSNLPAGLRFEPTAFDLGPVHASARQLITLREKSFPYKDDSEDSIRNDIISERRSILSFLGHCDSLGVIGIGLSVVTMLLAVVTAKWPIVYLHGKLENFDINDDSFHKTWATFAALPVLIVPICCLAYSMSSAANASFLWHLKLMKTMEWTTVTFVIRYGYGKMAKLHGQELTLIATTLASAYMVAVFMNIGLLAEMYFATYSCGSSAILLAPLGFITITTMFMNYAANDVEVRLYDFDAKLAVYKNLVDLGSGMEYIRAFGWQRHFLRRTFELLSTSRRAHYYALLMSPSLNLSIDIFVFFVALLVTSCPLFFELSSQASMGISLITVVSLSAFSRDVIDSLMKLTTALAPANHINQFIKDAPRPTKTTVLPLNPTHPSHRWPAAGGIRFENVTAYHDFAAPGEPPVLNRINVDIEAGKTVGLIGGIASGKTAFLAAIMGLVNYSGRISVDGIDIREYPDLFIQHRIVVVSGHLLEFPGTLRQNLDPLHGTVLANRVSDDVIIDVLKKLTLWREVVGRGATLDSPMTDMGLSRGQREVLAIGRAILRQKHLQAKVIIVDGTLSTADSTLDLLVNKVMADEFRGCTLIKVTHHLATLDDATQVIKMKEGRIDSVFQPGGGARRRR
ncbi:hypothetical protein PWT90_10412 [Aphanocladium album]|nr:hypothetical protein PWT90_10412 [Aphanocladium album]